MTIRLGFDPVALNVVLSADGDFASSLVADVAWPDGVVITLEFDTGTTWTATITGTSAAWHVIAADVATLLATSPRLVELHYADADVALLWAKGTVVVR